MTRLGWVLVGILGWSLACGGASDPQAVPVSSGDGVGVGLLDSIGIYTGDQAAVPADWPAVFRPPEGTPLDACTDLLGTRVAAWSDERPLDTVLAERKAMIPPGYHLVEDTPQKAVYRAADGGELEVSVGAAPKLVVVAGRAP